MRRILGALGVVLLLTSLARAADRIPSLIAMQTAGSKLRSLMLALPPPEPSEEPSDPSERKEPGQTFDEYLASNPNRPSRTRPAFYLQAVGDLDSMQKRLISEVEAFLNIAYGTSVKWAEAIPVASIPTSVLYKPSEWGPSGYRATSILEKVIVLHRPKDATSVLALTTDDLWTGEGLKVVFGRASFERHVAAMSLARIGDPEQDWNLVLERALKVASHEVAHTIGVFHCLEFECGMNETKSRGDLDHRPLAFCSECETKVWWACGLDPLARTQRLLEFCESRHLKNAANDYRRRLQALQMGR
jgi:archaemetzincin